jgi:ribosomal protein L40E
MQCPQCGSSNPSEAVRCEDCGAKLTSSRPKRESAEDGIEEGTKRTGGPAGSGRPARRRRQDEMEDDDEEDEYERRPRRRRRRNDDAGDEVISTIIPYKNPKALLSYYFGIFSLVCVIGMILAPVGLVLGIMGIRYRNAHPEAKGTAHAVVGITLSSISLLAHLAVVVIIIIGALKK